MANYKPKVDPLKAYKNPRRTPEAQSNWDNFFDNLAKSDGSKKETGAEEEGTEAEKRETQS